MPAEDRVTASIGLSLLILYFASYLVFLLRMPAAAHGSILLVCLAMTAVAGPGLWRLLRDPEIRPLLRGFGLLAVWSLVLLSLIRNYSGDNWYGDWLEHYQRSLFFLDRPESEIRLQGGYALPARPPLMNLLCAHFLAVAGREYAVYQVVSTLLSILIFFPASMLLRYLSRAPRAGSWALPAFLMCNPLVVQNSTYSWTKLLTVFYVLAGVCFYLRGWRGGETRCFLIAFTSLACGILSHYSAGPYTVFLAGHYLLFVFPSRPAKWRELLAITLAGLVILGTWFGYSVWAFGSGTLTATTSYFEAAALTGGQNVAKVLGNIADSFVPHFLRGVETQPFGPGLFWGPLRDASFKLYQFNLLFALGSLGSVLLVYSLYRATRDSGRSDRAERGFWVAFPIFCILAGIAVQGERYNLGLTHITVQPLVVLGVAFLAARFDDWPAGVRWLALAGLAIDLCVGVGLHFWLQSWTFGGIPPGREVWGLTGRDLLIGSVWANWKLKLDQGLTFLGDLLLGQARLLAVFAAALPAGVLALLAREAVTLRRGEGIAAPAAARPGSRENAGGQPRPRRSKHRA